MSDVAVEVKDSVDMLGQLNALTVRSNAARAAFGAEVQRLLAEEERHIDWFQINRECSS